MNLRLPSASRLASSNPTARVRRHPVVRGAVGGALILAAAALGWAETPGAPVSAGSAANEPAPTAVPAAPLAADTLTLDQAIRLALQNNPQIKVQAYGRSIARADWLTAVGQFDPALTFRRSYSESFGQLTTGSLVESLIKTDDYSLAFEGTTPWGMNYSIGGSSQNQRYPLSYDPNFVTFGGVSITQPLLRGFGFGPNLLNVRIAKADRGIADWQFRQTAIDIVTAVIDSYSELIYAQQGLRIAQRSRELAAGLLAENQRRFQVGSMSENDVTQARARTAERDEGVLFAQQGVRDSVNRLRQLIGETRFPVDPGTLATEPLGPPAEMTVNLPEDLRRAYNDRPDYQAARLGLVKRRANDSAARNQLLPQVDFVGSYGYNGVDRNFAESRRMVANYDNRSYSAGLVVSVPLTFAEGRGRSRSARLQLRQAEADLSRLEQDIAVAIASAAGQLDTTRRRVAANHKAYEYSKQALDAELKKLRAGTSNTLFVLQLQGELAAVEAGLYRSIADERRAQAEYDRQLGRTLAVNHIELGKP